MEEYVERMVQIREETKMSIAECAEKLQIDERLLVMIELGEMVPTKKQQEAIAAFVLDHV